VTSHFDLVLSYPQWQGSGRPEHLRRGAEATAEVCSDYGPLVRIPDSGEGEAKYGINRWTAILEQFRSARAALQEARPARILTAGGDCACDVAVIDYLHQLHPDLTVIWVDAHFDANTPETSPSGNFHGMPVAAIMGSAPDELLELLGEPLPPSQFRYIGVHVGDDGDWAFQREHALKWMEPGPPPAGPIHIHFDLDALDPGEFPHVAYPEGNLPIEAALRLVRGAAAFGSIVGLTITEFAPRDADAAHEGSRFIRQLCDAVITA
jgi:arginase